MQLVSIKVYLKGSISIYLLCV